MRLTKYQLAVLALISANIIWGASFPIYKWSMQNVPPYTFVFLRFFLAAVILLPFTIHNLYIARKDYLRLLALSFLGVTIPITCLFLGLQLTASINGSIITSAGPIVLILMSVFYLKEQPKTKTLIGTIVSLLGILIIIFRPIVEQGLDGSVLGNLLLLIATIGGVAHAVMMKKMLGRYSLVSLTFWYFFIASIPLLPMVIHESRTFSLVHDVNSMGFFGIAFGVIGASVLAHLFSNFGLQTIPANETGIFSYVDPLVTILIAIPLLGEVITPAFIMGAVLVFGGIFIAEGRLHYHPIHKLVKQ